ncbi:hypothetical protein DPMN_159345 [Dreissena polymorpha]|uniref:Uncharacterized protein n=1 Tax=Dreissena polymorpha TaxID=45954 RepID=A0A9D4EP36_DREPO|nr:hypothetical protein DPMN_159345 [Dreissena polymorpha]
MTRNFSSDFTSKFSERADIDKLWSNFKEFCTTAIDSNVPSKMTSPRYSQPWANKKIKRLSNKKNVHIGKPVNPMTPKTRSTTISCVKAPSTSASELTTPM